MDEKFRTFLNKTLPGLSEKGFVPFKLRKTDDLGDYASFIKNEGGVIYIAAFYDANADAAFRAKERFSNGISEFAAVSGSRNVILFHIMASDEITPEIRGFIDGGDEYYGQSFYEINYAAIFPNNRLYYNDRQPFDMLGLPELLSSGLKEDSEKPKIKVEAPQPLKSAIFVYALLIINVFVFIVTEITGGVGDLNNPFGFGALIYDDVVVKGEYYRMVTSIFLHFDIFHLIFNSVSLFIFGVRVEKYYGSVKFLIIYFVSGVMGSAAALLFLGGSVAAGASGAIFGLMGAALARSQVTKKYVGGLNNYAILLFIVIGIAYGFAVPGVGNAAHIGGLICGCIVGYAFSKINA